MSSLARPRRDVWKCKQEDFDRVDSGYNTPPDEFEITIEEYASIVTSYIFGGTETKQVSGNSVFHEYRIFYLYDYTLGVAVDKVHDYRNNKSFVRFLKIGTMEEWSDFTSRFAAQFIGDNS